MNSEFRERERLWAKARHDEAQALSNAEERGIQKGEALANTKWQGVVADKDAENERLRLQIAELQTKLGN